MSEGTRQPTVRALFHAARALSIVAVVVGMRTSAFAVPVYVNETFTSTATVSAFQFIGNQNGQSVPCLTASSSATGVIPGCSAAIVPTGGQNGTLPDNPGSGTLRLTTAPTAGGGASSIVVFAKPFPSNGGFVATYDQWAYLGTSTGADGIALQLLDAASPPTKGGTYGGSLGYTNVPDGYVGVGMDEYGNFAVPKTPENLAIRGSVASAYAFIFSSGQNFGALNQKIDSPTALTRGTAVERNVRVTLTPGGFLKVEVDFSGTRSNFQTIYPSTKITTIGSEGALPANFLLAFSASVGASENIHEIANVSVVGLGPAPALTKSHASSPFFAGQTYAYTLTPSMSLSGGPTDQPVTVTDTLPTGESYVSSSGTGWTCSNSGQIVTCTSTNAIAAGANGNPITLSVLVAANPPATEVNTATIATPDQSVASVNATDSVPTASSPSIQIIKRLVQVVSKGPTGAGAPVTTVPTPDPGSPAGVTGTASYPGVYPGDVLTYELYYLNVGAVTAYGPGNTGGPVFTDVLNSNLTLVPGSSNASCCVNPSAATGSAFSLSNQTITYTLTSSLAPYVPSSTNAYEGTLQYSVTVN